MIVGGDDKPSLDELVHYGVKGMKWGVRAANAKESFQRNRQLNKESRARDRAARDRQIDAARERISNHTRADYLKVKQQFKTDKKTLGSREARKNRREWNDQFQKDFETAQLAKSGKETTLSVLAAVGSVTLRAVVGR